MSNKSRKSIDGFIPRKSGGRTVGFDKSQPLRQTVGFPDVGTTLPTYPRNIIGTRSMPLAGPVSEKRNIFRGLKFRLSLKRTLLILGVLLLCFIGVLGLKFAHDLLKIFHGNVFGLLSTTQLKGEDTGRVNILLAGNSSDDPGHQGATLTDSVMILSIDTKDKTAYMLSIPRDLWVEIPGYGHSKINEAYPDGQDEKFDQSGYFPGGMGLLQQVIQQNFDITLDYYALINYNAFRDAVNAVGGVQLTINSSDPRGLYDPNIDYTTHGPLVKLSNGKHTLNGEQALDLARARGDAYNSYGFPQSDFDRTEHQRDLLIALKNKALSTGVLANPVKLSNLADALGNNIKTNFTLSEMRRLYDIAGGINSTEIKSASLNNANGKNLLTSYTSYGGESALIPAAGLDDFSQIELYVKQLSSKDPVVKEAATVVVLNGTDAYGVATKASGKLTDKGLDVVAVGDASDVQSANTIIDNSEDKKPATKQYLEGVYGHNVTTTNPYADRYKADFIIIIGNSQVSQ